MYLLPQTLCYYVARGYFATMDGSIHCNLLLKYNDF